MDHTTITGETMTNLQMKFRCNHTSGDETNRSLRLGAVTGPENEAWATATPVASLETTITKPGASSFFKEGKEYIATFQEV